MIATTMACMPIRCQHFITLTKIQSGVGFMIPSVLRAELKLRALKSLWHRTSLVS